MYTLSSDFDIATFLNEYWQKKPLVIRQGLTAFSDPIDENDLAGLAQEDDVDSRIVSVHDDEQWHVYHGPFDDYNTVCQGKWTLLVQGVDRYSDDINGLMEAFNFIPYWRMDDVMISYAVKGAGVGPHTDQYDVFLIQGKGKRAWQVGAPGNYTPRYPHKDLQQIAGFAPQIDVVLEPGDILYIPPGWPHDGQALEDCLTYSVGFRAPDQHQILQHVTDELTAAHCQPVRYSDPNLTQPRHPGMISPTEVSTLREMIIDLISSPDSDHALMSLLSMQHLPESDTPVPVTTDEVRTLLENGGEIIRLLGCKPVFNENQNSTNFTFYVNGEAFHTPKVLEQVMWEILRGAPIDEAWLGNSEEQESLLSILALLINKGYWEMIS
ncbi:cupin domain-containing protein [Alteromonas sp. C1M14]|uniref:cupin domain-containing protein n=1 Tax=Alteromonas sp. C1M14 TaxID=2841567 RepID=UPI001C084C94|nr:cupin domain-containing protein [Alteromonas sp. C1M14]MBU2977072.1 cupin domain-containing protein [Alteromonas sp. C1M14]